MTFPSFPDFVFVLSFEKEATVAVVVFVSLLSSFVPNSNGFVD